MGYFCLSTDILHLFCVEKQGPSIRLGKEGVSGAALLRNHPILGSSHPARGQSRNIQDTDKGNHYGLTTISLKMKV